MKRILLVDDDPAVLRGVWLLLAGRFEIDVAEGAEAAAAMVEQRDYHGIVSDFSMPGKDGIWLLERVMQSRPTVRRVLTSALPASTFDGSKVAERFVQKPARLQDLLDALDP